MRSQIPNEDTENFREVKKKKHLQKKEREAINTYAIKNWCEQNECKFKQVQNWHLRVSFSQHVVDIFPQTKKYHNVTIDERGKIQGKIKQFLIEWKRDIVEKTRPAQSQKGDVM